MGAGESYMDGLWSCDDLTAAVQIFAKNPHLLKTVDSGLGRSLMPLYRMLHRLKRNTRRGSRQNISEHYDLGNEFFSLFLDKSMMYSCAYFDTEESTLGQASLAKMDRICRKLELGPNDHLIEIGTGWGGFAIHAASRFGCRVTTTTISEEQFRSARDRIRKAGLDEQVTVLKTDYRDLRGNYDKLVSIEMIEAVGHDFLGEYFRKCSSLLHPGGLGLIQAIIKAEEFFEESKKSVDFIQRYIFPGSDIPSLTSIREGLKEAPELKLSDLEDMTSHYAETLRHWRMRFSDRLQEVRELGFSEKFIRMWDFYFSYCEGGFREKHIGDVQLLLEKA
jgi:cyclopropane-fatty-acyl-phospholipid synthase